MPQTTVRLLAVGESLGESEATDMEGAFSLRLAAKLETLCQILERGQSEEVEAAWTLAHQLCGTAASFGYQGVGDLVGIVEGCLFKIREGATRPDFFWERARSAGRDALRLSALEPENSPTTKSTERRKRRTLLVIDDDTEFLHLMRSLARRHSVPIVTEQTIEAGLTAAEGLELSAAILDVHLAGGSSFPAVSEIRSRVKQKDLPVIFTSADGQLETRIKAVAAGADRFLDKPLSAQSFSELLHQVPFSEQTATRIVVMDDDEIVLEKYESELREAGHFVRGITSASQLFDALEAVRPDALLLDVNLDGISGVDVCRALRASQRWQFLPILMFSSDRDADMRVRAYRAGASDVLSKPLAVDELIARVTVQAERIRLMREHSDRDALSGVMLRRAFVEAVQRALATCHRERKPLVLVLCDLDHFKQINDTHGHLMGDRVISAFGNLLKTKFRLEDLRGRWGGEEFVLAFTGQSIEFGRSVAERLLQEFSQLVFTTEDGKEFQATFTAGVASFPNDGESLDLLVKRADQRLYRGKAAGRGCVVSSE
jgi:diguanylate cyclase (GGDEF)-like protein